MQNKNEIFFQKQKAQISQRLKKLIAFPKASFQKELFSAAKYALFPGGKRLRPLLVLATVQTLSNSLSTKSNNLKKALNPACALEMMHTYSLVHDDLPCMDNDDLRHGKPALHKAYPEWLALLTGDFFLNYAFAILAQAPNLTSEQKLALIQVLAKYSGGEELLAGQYVDLSSEKKKIPIKKLEYMHLKKTSSLITAALEFGAIIANLPSKEKKMLISFGQKIGLAYQLIDDAIDSTSSSKKLGKPQGSDKSKGKANALTVMGTKEVQKKAEKLYQTAILNLKKLPYSTELLQSLAYKMINRSF